MKCENNYCIYEKKGECMVDEIVIDRCGMCSEYVCVDIDEIILMQEKEKLLKIYSEE